LDDTCCNSRQGHPDHRRRRLRPHHLTGWSIVRCSDTIRSSCRMRRARQNVRSGRSRRSGATETRFRTSHGRDEEVSQAVDRVDGLSVRGVRVCFSPQRLPAGASHFRRKPAFAFLSDIRPRVGQRDLLRAARRLDEVATEPAQPDERRAADLLEHRPAAASLCRDARGRAEPPPMARVGHAPGRSPSSAPMASW
jgi:hypothetical protein